MTTNATVQATQSVSETMKAAIVAAVLGSFLLFIVGFAPAMQLHNAAHDTRHTLSFPCH